MDWAGCLRELVAVPSESGREDAAAERVASEMKGLGWTAVCRDRNVHALLGDSGPLLLLNSHTDTVPVGAGGTKAPHGRDLIDGRLYGRGANDAKGCLVAMIAAA